MALRRPPTRVEMKADDIDEYSKVSDDRETVKKRIVVKAKADRHSRFMNHCIKLKRYHSQLCRSSF